jgi:beta-ureidopropionase
MVTSLSWRACWRSKAEIITRPSALLRSYDIWYITNCARAYDNHVYLIGVNAVGADAANNYYFGNSMIIDPTAWKLAQARGVEEIVSAELDPEPLRYISHGTCSPQIFDHLEDRNLALYEEILRAARSRFEPARRVPYAKGRAREASAE